MHINITTNSKRVRLTVVCEEEPRKKIIVRSHHRVVNGKIVYVKTHLRKR